MRDLELFVGRERQETITSPEIARIAGKQHKDVMRAIRSMEPAWEKVCGRNFALTSNKVKMPNGGTRQEPCYRLTMLESLFIATKFNDEARAKLVMRWMELEQKEQERKCKEMESICKQQQLLTERLEDAEEDADYARQVLQSHGTLTSTMIAKELGMSARKLHKVLHEMGIIFCQSGEWQLYAPYQGMGLMDKETMLPDGHRICYRHHRWSERGHRFVMDRMHDYCTRMTPRAVCIQLTFKF